MCRGAPPDPAPPTSTPRTGAVHDTPGGHRDAARPREHEFARWLQAQHSALLLASGEELTVRQASVADVPGLLAMHFRCSRRSRRLRYLSGGRPGAADLTRMVNRRHGRTLVVAHPDATSSRWAT